MQRQGHRLAQIGIAFWLFISLEGFIVPLFKSPSLGLAAHRLGGLEGTMLVALGLLWPRLQLSARMAALAFWSFVYSAFATFVPYILAAMWGAGDTAMPMAAAGQHGTALQELTIKATIYSSAPFVILSLVLILYGLRTAPRK